ncbi:restriction endonuclease [Bosea sp. (in: a-proteobacteria)]|uniref:restriction endonuclease n=1 Tax=Bosea sp. (in: a-proteobacteria) TaxID=1871050 RepID=UPI002734A208|nr:restriction endonuclease [Bosea sp. (in: a-proteobacteria)]MDP3410352.1 restriction endonuclease [Bosea sp. (in: a-proteobacteria)]
MADAAKKTTYDVGTEYEQFVQVVYQALVEADGVRNVNVQHNIKLRGKSGCDHQIDVYWEFIVAGQTYRTAIECKAFNTAVSIGRIRDFYGVLLDVPNLSGMFVTLVGYQSGARNYADHYGIALREIRTPTDADWNGRVRTVVLQFHIVDVKITKLEPIFTQAFLESIDPENPLKVSASYLSDTKIIFDENGKAVLSRDDFREDVPDPTESVTGQKLTVNLPNHTIKLGGTKYPIDGVNVFYDVNIETEERRIDGAALVRAMIRDAITGELKVVTSSGEVRTPSSE